MAWIEKLYQTYEASANRVETIGPKLWPIAHFVKNAHLEIAIDPSGKLRRVRVLNHGEAPTLVPATEDSAGRTSGEESHPLCEELSYCAGDLPDGKPSRFEAYRSLLERWCASDARHPKAEAVLACISEGKLWSMLHEKGIFPVVVVDAKGKKVKVADGKVFVRWLVEAMGDPCSATWEDQTLIESWQRFDAEQTNQFGLCMVLGTETRLTLNHPRFIRYPGDGAKVISSNDFAGFTFRGRFTDEKKDFEKKARKGAFKSLQGCGVSFEVSQKAHAALRWLIKRQSYRTDEQVYVAWAVAGKSIPDPWADSLSMILGAESVAPPEPDEKQIPVGDAGQAFALRLRRAIAGYGAKLDSTDDVVVMGLDSATPGRMAIIYYRELKGSEFLQRIEAWHAAYAWQQNFGKEKHFTGAPAPHDIAEAAFGRRLDDKLKKATVERLLPCIVDGRPVPRDLVISAVRRAANRAGLEHWEWEKVLGIACGLFRGWSKSQGKEYAMALEEDRTSRDYLYGRLLAVADSIESYVLGMVEKPRDTAAAQLMQRFADHPYSTWRTIELRLRPYISRLRSSERKKVRAFLAGREKTMDEIHCRFASADFSDDSPLSGEFLLGYHCQRAALFAGSNSQTSNQSTSEDNAS
ncbi:MAG: type I-C CRISPR-associated protein Cas8c/Csd1 [Rhodocyclales bacterium]|nr:type I-C CRISPR-associated protein Cas8c/Csd1 [Rhodocyclales bacterium]